MTKTAKLCALLFACVIVVTAGCGSKKAKTPKEAVVNLTEAIEDGNKGLFMANVHCDDKELAEAMFDGMVAMRSFTEKFEKEYGKDKAGEFSKMRQPSAEEVAEKVKIEEKGDKATARMPDEGPMNLIKQEGYWKVDMSELAKQDQSGQMKEMMKRMATAAKKAEDKVGKDEYKDKPGKIISELMTEVTGVDMEKMMKEMGDAMQPE